MNKAEVEKVIQAEVEHWPEVKVEFAAGGKHPKAKFWFGGKMLSRPYAGTLSDSSFGIHRILGDMRRIMKQLGAKRDKPEPTKDEDEAPYRKPNEGAAKRASPAQGEKAGPKTTMAEKVVGAVGADIAKEAQRISEAEASAQPDHDPAIADELEGPGKAEQIQALADAIEDGIYFNLPAEVYHATRRLGAGGLNDLNVSPATFWRGSWLDPDRPELDEDATKAQTLGKAYHCARLEPADFEARFAREPCKDDYAEQARAEGACWNGTEIGNKLAELGQPKKTTDDRGVADQAMRLEDAGFKGVIWPLIQHRFNESLALTAPPKTPIQAKHYDEIVRDMERIRGSAEIADLLSGGEAEVSVFWTDKNAIPRKARFDYLKVEHWADLKTFDNSRGKRLDQALADAVRFNRYHLTAASYREASEAIRTGQVQIKGEALDAERELVARIQIKPESQECWFIFQEKNGVPNLLGRRFVFFDVPQSIETQWDTGASEEAKARGHAATRRPTQIYQRGMAEVDYAKRLFVMYSQIYPPGQPWAPFEPLGTISDSDFSPHWLEGRYE